MSETTTPGSTTPDAFDTWCEAKGYPVTEFIDGDEVVRVSETTPAAPATSVTIIGPNLPAAAGATFHVHRDGCADITRSPLYRGADRPWSMLAASEREVIECVYSDIMAENDGDLAGWQAYTAEFRFFPCVGLPVEVTA